MSDFSDRPFVAGSLVGVRSFRVDSLGRLTGVNYQSVWKPGVNVAECRVGEATPVSMTIGRQTITSPGFILWESSRRKALPPSAGVDLEKAEEHKVGELGCRCGWYAYYDDGSNPHHGDGQVLGLIEGFGRTTVGSRGFRCEKARLIGLVEPGREKRRRGRPFDWLAAKCYDRAPVIGGSSVGLVLAATFTLIAGCLAWGGWGAFLSPLLVLGAAPAYLALRSIDIHPYGPDQEDAPNFALVRRNYPDVPVYPSLAAARAEHPFTPPPPPTPDDPDFWTRSAS